MNQFGCPFSKDPNSQRSGESLGLSLLCSGHNTSSPSLWRKKIPTQKNFFPSFAFDTFLEHKKIDMIFFFFIDVPGTGGPVPGSTFQSCDGTSIKRTHDGGIPDEIGKSHQEITNDIGTLSMANTGESVMLVIQKERKQCIFLGKA